MSRFVGLAGMRPDPPSTRCCDRPGSQRRSTLNCSCTAVRRTVPGFSAGQLGGKDERIRRRRDALFAHTEQERIDRPGDCRRTVDAQQPAGREIGVALIDHAIREMRGIGRIAGREDRAKILPHCEHAVVVSEIRAEVRHRLIGRSVGEDEGGPVRTAVGRPCELRDPAKGTDSGPPPSTGTWAGVGSPSCVRLLGVPSSDFTRLVRCSDPE